MFAALCDLANNASADSLEAVVADWFKFIRITGLRCAEYAQKTQSAFDEHEYPSGKRIVKAFIPTDWKFYDSSGAIMNIHPAEILGDPYSKKSPLPSIGEFLSVCHPKYPILPITWPTTTSAATHYTQQPP
jgi:hypothetical protein